MQGVVAYKTLHGFVLVEPSIWQCTKVVSLPQPDRLQCERVLIAYKAVMVYEGITVVASLKSRRWTSFCVPYELKSGPVVNERLHWVANRDDNGTQFPTHQVVYFDPLKDEFVEFSIPLPYYGDRNIILGLGVLDGCLCAARYCHCESVARHIRCQSGYDYYAYEPDIEVLNMAWRNPRLVCL